MHVILWRFRVRPGLEAQFETVYGDEGRWARCFRTGEEFVGTELMRGTDGTYLTIDRWTSRAAYEAFRNAHARQFAELDAEGETLTIEETLVAEVEA